jgi:Pentapeptide repeats (8 copies)
MINHSILNRYSGNPLFTAPIDCSADAPPGTKDRLAVIWALQQGKPLIEAKLPEADLARLDLGHANLQQADLTFADLTDASLWFANVSVASLIGANMTRTNLTGANLTGTHLSGANLTQTSLRHTNLIVGANRSDGFRFMLVRNEDKSLTLHAGCRRFDLPTARRFWKMTRGGSELGTETFAIIDNLEHLARLRGWIGVEEPSEDVKGEKS